MRNITWEEIHGILAGLNHYHSLFEGLEYRQDVANAEGQEELVHELKEAVEGGTAA